MTLISSNKCLKKDRQLNLNLSFKESLKLSRKKWTLLIKNLLFLLSWEESINWALFQCLTIFIVPDSIQHWLTWLQGLKYFSNITLKIDIKWQLWLQSFILTLKAVMILVLINVLWFMLLIGVINFKLLINE